MYVRSEGTALPALHFDEHCISEENPERSLLLLTFYFCRFSLLEIQ